MKFHRRVALAQGAFSVLFIALLALQAAGRLHLPYFPRLEYLVYDSWLAATAPSGDDDRVVILDIDEKSLRRIGRWPWDRAVMARLVQRLFDRDHIAALGFDVVFAEADQSSGLRHLEALASGPLAQDADFRRQLTVLRPRLDYDARFAAALAGRPVALGYYFIPAGSPASAAGVLPAPAPAPWPGLAPDQAVGYGANIAQLARAAPTAGFFNMLPDEDGTARRADLLLSYRGGLYPALAVSTLNTAFGAEPMSGGMTPVKFLFWRWRQPWLSVAGLRLPMDRHCRVYIPYRAGKPFRYISAADLLAGRVAPDQLENRIVLMGSTAPGLADQRVTPFSNAFPGVEIHAALIAGMLDGTLRYTPPWGRFAAVVAVLAVGLAMLGGRMAFGPLGEGLLALALLAGMLAGYGWLWSRHWVLPLAPPLAVVVGLFLFNSAWGFFSEFRAKRQITRLFGQYVPPPLAEEMSRDPGRYTMAGQSREMTVLFSDIRGFTDFSENLPPAELAEVLNAYLSIMTAIVQGERGTIDKYIGDALMAFWNAPVDLPDHARRAVAAALAMQAALPQINQDFARRGWPVVKIGVGISSGRMSVGNMGSSFRLSYTVMGDAVNLGSRLEGLTKQYGVGILVTDATRMLALDFLYRPVDVVRVKGKATPVAIFEPLGRADAVNEVLKARAESFGAALACYRGRDWDGAEAILTRLQAEAPERLYEVYRERIAHFRAEPPPADWSGVYVFSTR